MQFLLAGIIGLVGGITSGLFGVGGGVVMVPAMMFFLGADIKTAVGTSLAVIIPTALTGTFKHHSLGNVNWTFVAMLVPMAIVGGYLGSYLTKHIDATTLKRGFGGFIMIVGARLLFLK